MSTLKGLLIKDWKLIKNQKMFIIITAAVYVLILLICDDASSGVIYITVMFSYLAVSTLSYDEADNCMTYLFTLPMTRKNYASEKYVFGFLVIFIPWFIGWAGILIVGNLKGGILNMTEFAVSSVGGLMAAYLVFGLVFPLQLKLGPEKSRIAICLGFLVFGVILAVMSDVKEARVAAGMELTNSADLPDGVLMLAMVLIVALLMFLSYRLSVNIVEKKQF